jgi:hypothetical protein
VAAVQKSLASCIYRRKPDSGSPKGAAAQSPLPGAPFRTRAFSDAGPKQPGSAPAGGAGPFAKFSFPSHILEEASPKASESSTEEDAAATTNSDGDRIAEPDAGADETPWSGAARLDELATRGRVPTDATATGIPNCNGRQTNHILDF